MSSLLQVFSYNSSCGHTIIWKLMLAFSSRVDCRDAWSGKSTWMETICNFGRVGQHVHLWNKYFQYIFFTSTDCPKKYWKVSGIGNFSGNVQEFYKNFTHFFYMFFLLLKFSGNSQNLIFGGAVIWTFQKWNNNIFWECFLRSQLCWF